MASKAMHQAAKDLEEAIEARGEKMILLLSKSLGKRRFRYAIGEGGNSYSVYAEYTDEKSHTVGAVTDFSNEKEIAEGFCRLLSRILATPLSLEAIYEDSLTP